MSGNPYLLLVLVVLSSLVAGAALGVAVEKARAAQRRENWRARNGWRQRQDRSANNVAAGPRKSELEAMPSNTKGRHYRGSAVARDAVKKEALRRAGIGYHEVVAGHTTPSDLRRLVERLVDRPAVTQGVSPPGTSDAKA